MAEAVLGAVFKSHGAAEEAVRKVGESGLPICHMSALGQNRALISYGLSQNRALKLDTCIKAGEYVLLM